MKRLMKCDLCNGKDFEFLFKNHDRMHPIEGEYTIERCRKCGLIFLNPQPTGRELEKHYPEDFYSFKGKTPRKFKIKLYKTLFSKSNIFLKLIFMPFKVFLRSIKIVKNGKFLDVGCGSGDFLLVMKELGMDCYGVEPGKFDREFAKRNKLKIFHGTLEKAEYPDNFFDVISLTWVFEHVSEPMKTMKELNRILKPNGTLIMAVPQSNSMMLKLFKENWYGLDTPRHLFIYSPENLELYGKKTGFKLKKKRYLASNLLPTILYWKNKFRIKEGKKEIYLREKNFSQNLFLQLLFMPFNSVLGFLGISDSVEVEFEKMK